MTTLTSSGSTYRIMEQKLFDVKEFPEFEALEVLLHDYRPAERDEDDIILWSTSDITNSLIAHIGDENISMQAIYACMLFLGYNYTSQGTLRLEWMLKRK